MDIWDMKQLLVILNKDLCGVLLFTCSLVCISIHSSSYYNILSSSSHTIFVVYTNTLWWSYENNVECGMYECMHRMSMRVGVWVLVWVAIGWNVSVVEGPTKTNLLIINYGWVWEWLKHHHCFFFFNFVIMLKRGRCRSTVFTSPPRKCASHSHATPS